MKKKLMVLLMVVVSTFSFLACGGIDPEKPQKLEIYVYNAGYGYQWAEDILAAFKEEPWVKEKYPELETSFMKDELGTKASELLAAKKKINKYDILMGTGLETLLGPGSPAADLTESVYDSKVPGEDILFKDKMIQSYLSAAAYNGKGIEYGEQKWYQVNWASGMTGMIYNEDRLTALGFNVPNTSDELVAIMRDVKALNGTHPAYPANKNQTAANLQTSYATYGASSYAQYLFYTWWAQYETVGGYNDFYNGIDSEGARSPEVLRQKGLLKAYETLESYMHKDMGYTWINPNTDRSAYRETQNRVLLGNALFMANGDWVDNELAGMRQDLITKDGHADTVKMMRTPVISAIREKTPSITSDAMLSAVVAAIDAGESGYETVTSADYAVIEAARKVVYSIGPYHSAVIPDYASGKAVAIDFLRYMATDKANEIYIKATNGASLPFNYDVKTKNPQLYGQISSMQQGRLDYFAEMDISILPVANSFPLARYGSFSPLSSGSPMTDFTGGASKGTYASVAEMIYNRGINYWTENGNSRWNTAVSQAGL